MALKFIAKAKPTTAKVAMGRLVPREVYRAGTTEKIALIKGGVTAREAKTLISSFPFEQQLWLDALHLKTATVNKKAKEDKPLSSDESERVLGLAELVGQVEAMVEESGDPEGFDAHAWLAEWLKEPVPALGGVRPIDYLDTVRGQMIVSKLLSQMQSGAYA